MSREMLTSTMPAGQYEIHRTTESPSVAGMISMAAGNASPRAAQGTMSRTSSSLRRTRYLGW